MNAQDTITRNMIYKTTVKLISNPSFRCYGALYEVNDSSISISSHRIKDYYSGNLEVTRLHIEDVNFIVTKKPGSGGRGALIGAVSGVALGALMGLVGAGGGGGPAIIHLSVTGLIVGVPTGYIFGKIAGKHIPINGSIDEFNLNKDKLKGYSIKK